MERSGHLDQQQSIELINHILTHVAEPVMTDVIRDYLLQRYGELISERVVRVN